MNGRDRSNVILLLEITILVIMGLGVFQQAQKATLPSSTDSGIVTEIDGVPVSAASSEAIEVLLDRHTIGESITIVRDLDGRLERSDVTLVPLYRGSMIAIISIVAGVYLFIAGFVRRRKPDDHAARVFHALGISFGLLVACSTGSVQAFPTAISTSLRFLFFLVYTTSPVLLVHFGFVFASRPTPTSRLVVRTLYVLAAVLATHHLIVDMAVGSGSWTMFRWFDLSFLSTHVWFAVLSVGCLVIVIHGYRQASTVTQRRKVLWVLFGMGISVVSYISLWVAPLLVTGKSIIPEDAIVALSVVAPISFAIAIIRYRALDINVIVKMSAVHGTVIALALATYTVVVTLAIKVVGSNELVLEFVIPAIIVLNVILFAPVRGVIQRTVDRLFFRIEYDYRNTLNKALATIRESLSTRELADAIQQQIVLALQPSFVRVVLIDEETKRTVQSGESDNGEVALRRDLTSVSGKRIGKLDIGPKRSQQNFTDEDVDLVNSITAESEIQIDRFRLHHSLRTEQEKAEHEASMNKLKSLFVSSVSHDLKTPLTSIRMYAELLERQARDPQTQRYLKMIEGESERLARLVDNVLDYAKIEREVMEYDLHALDINVVVRRAIEVMEYPVIVSGFTISVAVSNDPLMANAAADALQDAVINLISNAIKYSHTTKTIAVSTFRREQDVVIEITDQGIGIPTEALSEIFTPFVRVKDPSSQGAGGVGLGLALVKHCIDAHGGRIEIESELQRGTTVRLVIPRA